MKSGEWHGSGHQETEALAGTVGFIILSAVFLLLTIMYLMYRVYKQKKRFSSDWIKEFGE